MDAAEERINQHQSINQSINHPFTLQGWRPWRPVRVEQPNSHIQTSRQPFENNATGADGD
jgi:hypothetical protein